MVMTYKQDVKAAGAALKQGEDANWELARLTFENTKVGSRGEVGQVSMTQWCADIVASSGRKFNADTGRLYRRIWAEYGSRVRTNKKAVAWSDAYWSVRSGTLQENREQGSVRTIAKASPQTKREAFKTLAADPAIKSDPVLADVAKQTRVSTPKERVQRAQHAIADLSEDEAVAVVRDKKTAVTVARAEIQVGKENAQRQALNQTPLQARHNDERNWLMTMSLGHNATSDLRKMLKELRERGKLTTEQIDEVKHFIKTIRVVCDWMETTVGAGAGSTDASFERQLADLLNSEGGE